MTDERDDIAVLLQKMQPPEPKKEVKNEAINKAMLAYEQKISSRRQGIALRGRLMDTVRTVHETLFGERTMKTAYVIAGGLCLGAVGITLMNTSALFDFGPKTKFTAISQNLDVTKPTSPVVASEGLAPVEAAPPVPEATRPREAVASAPEKAKKDFSSSESKQPVQMDAMMMGGQVAQRASAPAGNKAGQPASVAMYESDSSFYVPQPQVGNDKFSDTEENIVKIATEEPVSTFSVDVDTASYAFVRSSLNGNALPPKDAVRVEELINYFPYEYEAPKERSQPFKAHTSVYNTPWNKGTKLLHVGIKGYQLEQAQKPHSNLVFLLDTSGSMYDANKLPLVQQSLTLLLDTLEPDDTISIVTYAGSAGVALEPTKAKDKAKILSALNGLAAGGSTAGAEGIRQAYHLAEQNFDREGVNRVILATDGDFNVGITDPEELKRFVEKKRDSGVFLSVLGFGRGNYNDELMQVLAQNGNGNASYIDNLNEARKVLVEEAGSTLFPIAKDVKIQVEFNPAAVSEYRLIGYETRILNREDFNNDKVDAGDIGAGHTVTALYEITPRDSDARMIDELRYKKEADKADKVNPADASEYAFVKIRYKLPEGKVSKLLTYPVAVSDALGDISEASNEVQFATSVAAFGQMLKGERYTNDYSYDDVVALANRAKGDDVFGYRAEFINLVRLAKSLQTIQNPAPKSR